MGPSFNFPPALHLETCSKNNNYYAFWHFLLCAIEVSTSKSFQLCPLLFSSFDFEKKSSIFTTTVFSFLAPTLASHSLFFYVGWLNSFSLIFTISIIFSTKFECCENTIEIGSPRNCAPSSLQGIFMCDACEALLTG